MHKIIFVRYENERDCEVISKIISFQKNETYEIRFPENDLNFFPSNNIINICKLIKERKGKVLLEIRNEDIIGKTPIDGIYLTTQLPVDRLVTLIQKARKYSIKVIFRVKNKTDFTIAQDLQKIFPKMIIYCDAKEIDFSKDLKTLNNTLFLDLPLCVQNTFHIQSSPRLLFDIKGIISGAGYEPLDLKKIASQYMKKKSTCNDCFYKNKCLGWIKHYDSVEKFVKTIEYQKDNLQYTTSYNFANSFFDTEIITFDARNPNNAVLSDVNSLQSFRKTHEFEEHGFYHIMNPQYSFYFNRRSELLPKLFNWDERGLPSLDLQYIGINKPELQSKLKQDLLIPEHSVDVLVNVKFNDGWSLEKQYALKDFTINTIKDLVKEFGDESKLIQKGNDLFYNNKKFLGQEFFFVENKGYTEDTVITCDFDAEIQWFKKLYNYTSGTEKIITGITNEIPNLTKDIIKKRLYQKSLNL